jgi:uncharacterized membrane protein (DUF485 family)
MSPVASDTRPAGQAAAGTQFQAQQTVWDGIAATPQFRRLMTAKKKFIIPVFIFFLAYYFALPLLAGYAPGFMSVKVVGGMSRAYVFALSQFFVAWAIAWRYVRAAGKFDKMANDIAAQAEARKGEK